MAFKKGNIPWSKGKKFTDEHRKKLSEARKGKVPWNKGVPMREESKEKLSKTFKGREGYWKGKKLSEQHCKNLSKARSKNPNRYWSGKKRDSETLEKISTTKINSELTPRGKTHPNWKGGHSSAHRKEYQTLTYKKWRRSVFKRDKYTCQECSFNGGYITAHHIKSFTHFKESRYDIDNGITLCEPCHIKTDNYAGRARLSR